MTVRLTSRGKSLDLEEIAKVETHLQVIFPDDFREFLLSSNVAIPEINIYQTNKITTSVARFLGVSDKEQDDLIASNRVYEGRLPEEMVAIGEAAGGNLICLNLKDGAVYFWDHEGESMGDEKPDFDNMEYLASSFSQFLHKLEPFKSEAALNPEDVKSVWKKPGFEEKFKNYLKSDEQPPKSTGQTKDKQK